MWIMDWLFLFAGIVLALLSFIWDNLFYTVVTLLVASHLYSNYKEDKEANRLQAIKWAKERKENAARYKYY